MMAETLHQRKILEGKRSLELKDDIVWVCERNSLSLTRFGVRISSLQSRPVRSKFFEKRCLIGALVALVFAIGFGSTVLETPTKVHGDTVGHVIMAVVCTFIAGFCLFFVPKCFQDRTVFHSRFDGSPSLVLWTNRPTVEEFRTFVDGLSQRVEDEVAKQEAQNSASNVAEIREFEDLWKQGILTEQEFKLAKARILDLESKTNSG